MSHFNHKDDAGPGIEPGVASATGGQVLMANPNLAMQTEDDPNGPTPDNEEAHDGGWEDTELFDPGASPEFDHSLRRRPS
jgi:hypothetical protein